MSGDAGADRGRQGDDRGACVEQTDLSEWAMEGAGAEGMGARLAGAVAALRAGRPVIHPTETVYGVGSDLSPEGVRAVRRAKSREDDRPVLALIPGVDAVGGLTWTDEASELARIFWPGALTLVLADPNGTFPEGVRSSAGTVAVRHSSHPVVAALVGALGTPMTSSSANHPGQPPARSSADAMAFAVALVRGEEGGTPPHLLVAGDLPASPPSTLIDCTGPTPSVIREGAVPVERLRCVLPEISG